MTVNEKENQTDAARIENNSSSEEIKLTEELTSEMNEPNWSVVTFENRRAGNLTYQQAVETLEKLAAEKVAGLCIITDEAAERIKN